MQPVPRFISPRRLTIAVAAAILIAYAAGCGSGSDPSTSPDLTEPDDPEPRSYAMGFFPSPPRPTEEALFTTIDSLSEVSDVTLIQQPVPWSGLLADQPMDSLLEERVGLADFLRSKGLEIVFLVDPLDGLDRTSEPPELVEAGRSILEPEIRAIHEEWVLEITERINPSWLGLASEINTPAAHGAPELYGEIVDLVNTLAPQIRQRSAGTGVFVSFQVDDAWHNLGGDPIDHFALIDDFDIDALGLSSYPVFVYEDPVKIPDNYLLRFREATDLPLLMVEGGWSSKNTASFEATPQEQAAFYRRFETFLDGVDAELWITLLYADLDIQALNLPPDRAETLSNFAFMGIADSDFNRKPAYDAWKEIFERPLGD